MSNDGRCVLCLCVQIPLSSGGQKRGHISGKFSLKYIPSALSASSPATPGASLSPSRPTLSSSSSSSTHT